MKYQIILICALSGSPLVSTHVLAQTVKSQYVISDERAGVTAYEYGRRTVLEFVSAPFSLSISDDKGLPVAYERISDRFYRTAKQLQDFSANINGEIVTFSLNRPEYFTKPTNAASTVMRNQIIKVNPSQNIAPLQSDTNQMSAPKTGIEVKTQAAALVAPTQPQIISSTPVVVPVTPAVIPTNSSVTPTTEIKPTQTATTGAKVPPVEPFEVTTKDANLRHLLIRWGKQTNPGWELVWQVARDIPLSGSTVIKDTEFKNAVRFVTAISSQSGFAVKPCFHTNNVVRIVAASEMCNSNTKEVN